ncbi:MAG TPA: DUF1295 domain-containing protein [Anaerolineales bacterium]|nr:DUF1295 domain-containing protein [Anaerolineales bacterium]
MNPVSKRSVIAIIIALLIVSGLALAGSQGGKTVNGFPIFAICVAVAIGIQWVAFLPAFAMQTETFYDLTGSLSFLTAITVAIVLSKANDIRSLLLAGMIALWALRLGTFLFTRVRAAGEDRRFREIKPNFARFMLTWTLQGLWVSFSTATALVVMTSTTPVGMDIFMVVGFVVWLFGFVLEVTADRQKRAFNANPANKGKFIRSGLWAWSRHPNYFGEIVLWIGVTIIALPVLRGWQWVTLISPLFITLLLTRLSGVPLLEKRADDEWGGQAEYEAYKAKTPVLIPRAPKP